jgi:hypothetical protein
MLLLDWSAIRKRCDRVLNEVQSTANIVDKHIVADKSEVVR